MSSEVNINQIQAYTLDINQVTSTQLTIDQSNNALILDKSEKIINVSAGIGTVIISDSGVAPVESVNGQTGVVVLDADDIDDSVTTNKFANQLQLDQIVTNTSDISQEVIDRTNADSVIQSQVTINNAKISADWSVNTHNDVEYVWVTNWQVLWWNGVNRTNIDVPIVDQESFETVSKNLKSNPYVLNYTGDLLTSIVYTTWATTSITKTLSYTGDQLTSVVLSGDLPALIQTTKTLTYTWDNLTSITYS